jgi:putative FmdB family regulatory protein
MPTYEYECKGCGHRFEQSQSITAAPIKICPECQKNKVVRLIGAGSGLIFKGSGFYATDYRKGSPGPSGPCPSSGSKPGCASCPNHA